MVCAYWNIRWLKSLFTHVLSSLLFAPLQPTCTVMVEGDKWQMFIPSELGYGDGGSPPKINGGDALIFTMEILEIQGDKVPAVKCDPTTGEECNDKEKKYIEKVKAKFVGVDAMTAEKDRIGTISKDLKAGQGDDLASWAKRRLLILEKLIAAAKESKTAEL